MYRQYSQAILARYRCIAYRRVLSAIKAIAFFICAAELRYLVVIELSHVSAAFFQPSSILLLRSRVMVVVVELRWHVLVYAGTKHVACGLRASGPNPVAVVCRMITLCADAQLISNIEVAFAANASSRDGAFEIAIGLPSCSAVRTGHMPTLRPRGSPVVEAFFVQIIATPTGSSAPDSLFINTHIVTTDRTLAFAWLASTILVVDSTLRRQRPGLPEDLAELRREQCLLIPHVLWCFEDLDENIYNMFAQRLGLLVVRTGTDWRMRDCDFVYVASRSCKRDFLNLAVLRGVLISLAVDDKHSLSLCSLENAGVCLRSPSAEPGNRS